MRNYVQLVAIDVDTRRIISGEETTDAIAEKLLSFIIKVAIDPIKNQGDPFQSKRFSIMPTRGVPLTLTLKTTKNLNRNL